MSRILFILIAVLMLASCSFNDAEFVDINELAYTIVFDKDDKVKSEVIPAEGGSMMYRIYSNGKVVLSSKGSMPEWASLNATEFENDSTITVSMEPNPGFDRVLDLVATLDGGIKKIEFSVKQYGSGYLVCQMPYKSVKGSVASEVEFRFDTNLLDEDICTDISYESGGQDWISSVDFSEKTLKVCVDPNQESLPRKAVLSINLKGADETNAVNLFLTQASSTDAMGEELSFSDLRLKATKEGVVLDEFQVLKGVVISDYKSKNMEQNPVLSLDEAGDMSNYNVTSAIRTAIGQVVDTTASERTAYIQAVDGSVGIKVVFDNYKENTLAFGDQVTLYLGGTVIRYEDNPARYTLTGLLGGNVLETIPGTVEPKVKKICELTDDDIYTYVGVTDVEFPVKEGSYTDIRENFALYSAVNQNCTGTDGSPTFYACLDSYVTTLVDKDGYVICCPINTLCQWRRPSEGLPQGTGSACGIITYNDIKRYGDAGRYQLRVVDATGFADLKNNSSNWRTIASWDKGVALSNEGNITITSEKPDAVLTSSNYSYKCVAVSGNGKEVGMSDKYKSLQVASPIKGWYKWNGDEITGYNGLCFDYSDLSASELMLTFRFYAGVSGSAGTYQGYPSHWCVEYSTDGGQNWSIAENGDLSGQDYVHLRSIMSYVLTWNGRKYGPSTSYTLGATAHSFTMDVSGKDSVKIRIRPYDNVMSSLYPQTLFDDVEHSRVKASSEFEDYVLFQDIILSYR